MKKKLIPLSGKAFIPSPEEYQLFQTQPVTVLHAYSFIKKNMAVLLPFCAFLTLFDSLLALQLSFTLGIISFLYLYATDEEETALVPFICMLFGLIMGFFLLNPILAHIKRIQGVFNGF